MVLDLALNWSLALPDSKLKARIQLAPVVRQDISNLTMAFLLVNHMLISVHLNTTCQVLARQQLILPAVVGRLVILASTSQNNLLKLEIESASRQLYALQILMSFPQPPRAVIVTVDRCQLAPTSSTCQTFLLQLQTENAKRRRSVLGLNSKRFLLLEARTGHALLEAPSK